MRAELREKRDAFLGKIGIRPVIMGILNVTPDSFSDGGRFQTADAAISHATRMAADGCDIVDVGGESTRPEAIAVSETDELHRIEPILAELARILDTPLSIDSYKATVATRAVALGAVLVNDVWGLQKDPAMAEAVAEAEAALVIMHNRANKDETLDIISDIRRFFDHSLALAEKAGIPRELIILDPGIAFGKTARQNLDAIAGIPKLRDYRLPILVGVSRKSFLGSLVESGRDASLGGTIAANLAAAANGAAIFRVHDVAEHVAAFAVFDWLRTGSVIPSRDVAGSSPDQDSSRLRGRPAR
jgi:dihydropteroate synthase